MSWRAIADSLLGVSIIIGGSVIGAMLVGGLVSAALYLWLVYPLAPDEVGGPGDGMAFLFLGGSAIIGGACGGGIIATIKWFESFERPLVNRSVVSDRIS